MNGLFVKNCKPTREGYYKVRVDRNAKEFWGHYVPRRKDEAEHWLVCMDKYLKAFFIIHKNFKRIEWMPSSYTDPQDFPLGGIYVVKE